MLERSHIYFRVDSEARAPVVVFGSSSTLRGPGRKYGTPVSGWQQQLVSRIGGLDHTPDPLQVADDRGLLHVLGRGMSGKGSEGQRKVKAQEKAVEDHGKPVEGTSGRRAGGMKEGARRMQEVCTPASHASQRPPPWR